MSENGDEAAVPGLPKQVSSSLDSSSDVLSRSSRVDRLLRERLRKSQSSTPTIYNESNATIYEGFPQELLEDSEPLERQRLIIIANRLPVTAIPDARGGFKLEPSSGGLASAMLGLGNFDITWIGWPGVFVPEGPARDKLTETLSQQGYHPVFLDPRSVDLYYNGFCNQVLWQLFHYVPLNLDSKLSETRTLQMQWQAYQEVNQKFADVAIRIHQENDVVWVQDYHLMLLPALLKDADPSMKVGWFLHTPFPSSEIYRTLPVREEVLRSALRADLVGFHTYDYGRHFVSACTRILGFEGTPEGVEGEDNGQITRVAAFPIGIDPVRFTAALEMTRVKDHISSLQRRYAGRKVMLGVDRLDMIKGIPQKLLAYEKFLEEHPEWRDKVLLVQIAVPTRMDVPEYQQLRAQVHEIVGRINGKFGTLTHCPIHHLDRGLDFQELCALYAVTDVALVTSLRDGMNLVSYEYVACQNANAGVLVLSEFAGAAQSLGAGAILVNPWNVNDMAAAISDALTMSPEERHERHSQNYAHVTNHTAQHWADTFISELNDTHVENTMRMRHVPPDLPVMEVAADFLAAKGRRMLVLGYNATLTQLVEAPRQPKHHFDQIKAHSTINPHVYELVRKLAAHPLITVVIFSGSDRFKLMETFGNQKDIWLVAENGVYIRPPVEENDMQKQDDLWMTSIPNINRDWLDSVQLVFEYFRERTPRSFVEVRESSLVWNYKYADVEFGRLQARDLLQHLWTGPISNAPVDIVQGSRSVEARPVSISKGMSMKRVMEIMCEIEEVPSLDFEYVLCMGHFLQRDENLYTYFEGKTLKEQHPQHSHSRTPSFPGSGNASSTEAPGAEGRKEPPPLPRCPTNSPTPWSTLSEELSRRNGTDPSSPLKEAALLPKETTTTTTATASHQENESSPSATTFHSHNSIDLTKVKPKNNSTLCSHSSIDFAKALEGLSPEFSRLQQGAAPPQGASPLSPGKRPIPALPLAACVSFEELPLPRGDTEAARLRAELGLNQTRRSPRSRRQSRHGPAGSSLFGSNSSGDLSSRVPHVTSFPPKYLYTCSVGRNQSEARYCLNGSKEVVVLLEELVGYLPRLPVRHLAGELFGPACTSPGRSGLRIPGSRNYPTSVGMARSPLKNANGGLYTRSRRHTIESSTPPRGFSPGRPYRPGDPLIEIGQ